MRRLPFVKAIPVLFLFVFVVQLSAAPVKLSGISVSPGSVTGGASATCTVTLSAAEKSSASVTVKSSDTTIVPSTTITVPAGQTSGSALLPTSMPQFSTTVTLTANYKGGKATATLNVASLCPLATQQPPSIPPGDSVWVDEPPAGLSPEVVWDTTQAASGAQSLTLPNAPAGVQSGFAFGLPTAITPSASDQFIAYVLIDPCNPPTSLGFTWSASPAGKVYGAYWGAPNPQWDSTTWWHHLGPLPAAGSWVRLTAPASELAGLVVDVSNTYQIGGKVWYDHYGIVTTTSCSLATQPKPSIPLTDEVWVDDTAWTSPEPVWDTTQAASGTQSLTLPNAPAGVQSGFAFGLFTSIIPAANDQFVVYVLIDPCNPPTTFGFTWSASPAGKVYGAYWGDPRPQWDSTSWWNRLGPLPVTGSWVRLTVPASALAGLVVDVSNTYQIGGKVWYDHYGRQQQ